MWIYIKTSTCFQLQEALNLSRFVISLQVGTPGRLADHLSNTKGFSLHALKYLVRHILSLGLEPPFFVFKIVHVALLFVL